MSATQVRDLLEILALSDPLGVASFSSPFKTWVIQSEDCMSYVSVHLGTKEVLLVDPKREDRGSYLQILSQLASSEGSTRVVAVVDTHTHADHVSCAAEIAGELGAPLVMGAVAPSQRVDLRVSRDTVLSTAAGPLRLLLTPGHTPDSLSALWGPLLFTGDTLLFGDSGRDDLPGGDAVCHYESLQKLKELVGKAGIHAVVVLPGHDHKGGRASSFAHQLRVNPSLIQTREEFVPEAIAFSAPAPALLKESLRENFK